MRKKEAEQVLQKFVQNKWLIEVVWFPQPGTFRTENSFSLKPYRIQLLSVELGPIRPLVCFNAHRDPMRRTWSLPLARVMWPGHPGQKCRAGTLPGLALWSTDVGPWALWVRAWLWHRTRPSSWSGNLELLFCRRGGTVSPPGGRWGEGTADIQCPVLGSQRNLPSLWWLLSMLHQSGPGVHGPFASTWPQGAERTWGQMLGRSCGCLKGTRQHSCSHF